MRMSMLLACAMAFSLQAETLTLEAAVEKALASHPDLIAARSAREIVKHEREAARALPVPELRFTANNVAADPEVTNQRNSVGWRWSPPRPGEIALKTKAVEKQRLAIEARIGVAEARLAAQVRQAYRRAVLSGHRARLAEEFKELRRLMVEVTRRQVASGVKDAVEGEIAVLSLADAEAAAQRAWSSAKLEKLALGRLLPPGGDDITLAPLSMMEAPALDRSALTSKALHARPELAEAGANCSHFRALADVARNRRYPWINTVQLNRRIATSGDSNGGWGIQLGIDLPFFRTADQAEAKIQLAEAARCRLEEKALRARIEGEVDAAITQIEALRADLDKLNEMTQGPLARAVEVTKTALAAGRADRLDVLQAEARQLALRERWLERRLELTALEHQLELAAGL